MSLSPDRVADADDDSPFMENQNRLYQFIREGKSFSGQERNCCFLNLHSDRFANISALSGLDFADDARALAVVDWDRDGDLDVWLTNRTAPRVRFLVNEAETEHHYLQLRLVGKRCARDAIGARVTVHVADQRLIRTLRAGDGYLAQSSKWLHFGLGRADQVHQVTIQWPDGSQQKLGPLTTDRHYLVQQDQPPQALARRETVVIADVKARSAPPSSARAVLRNPIPLPRLSYVSASDEPTTLSGSTQPTLLTLWASWCQPCLQELRDLAAEQDTFRAAGVTFLALSTDGLGDAGTIRDDAVAAWQRLQPEAAELGFADEPLLDRLQAIHNQCLGLHTPLPLPTSFLIDERGRLRSIYKGALDIKHLVSDVAEQEDGQRRDAGQAGIWIREPVYDLAFMVSMLLEDEQLDDAIDYLQRFDAEFVRNDRYAEMQAQVGTRLVAAERADEAVSFFERAVKLRPGRAAWQNDLGSALHRLGRTQESLAYFRRAGQLAPENMEIQLNLARVLVTQNEIGQALSVLETAIQRSPDRLPPRLLMADLLRQAGKIDDAVAQYQAVLKIDQENPSAFQNLGATLLAAGKVATAIPYLQKAAGLKPNDGGIRKNLALALAVSGQTEEAIREFRRCVEISPADPSIRNNLGGLLARAGRFAEAVPHFELAVQLQPGNPTYRRNLDSARKRLRNEKRGS